MAKLEDEKMDLYDMAKNMSENEYDMLINSAKTDKELEFYICIKKYFGKLYYPHTLYHYTNFTSMVAILSEGMGLCRSNEMNDKKEMLHFIDSVQEALRKRFNGRADIQDKIKERFAAEQEKRKNDVVYLASLSGLEDDVSQWVRYGNSGHGVAIGLNSTILKMTTDTSGVFLQEVFYDTDADQHQITESFEDFFLGKPYCRNWGEENDGEGLFDQLWMNAMAHKHPSFYSENEYRIATLPFGTRRRHDKLGELKMKMLPSGLKECLCLDFQEKCNRIGSSMDQLIDKIIIGPLCKMQENDIKEWAGQNGFDYLIPKIQKSKSPLR